MKKRSQKSLWIWRCALAVCLIVAVVFGGLYARDTLRANKEQALNESLAELVEEGGETAQPSGTEEPQQGTYDRLWARNNDVAGWLKIEDTKINLPVMYTPDDPEYYLRRDFEKNYALSGSLFIGKDCQPDSPHVIIYGHHMKDGSMFGDLDEYAQESYAKEHPIIHYDTLTDKGQYQVMGAFYSQIYTDQDTGVFRYYNYTALTDPAAFTEYVTQVKAASLYDTGVTAAPGDQIITLSTCSYHTEDGRFVVVAKRIN